MIKIISQINAYDYFSKFKLTVFKQAG